MITPAKPLVSQLMFHVSVITANSPELKLFTFRSQSSYSGPCFCFHHHCYDSSWNGVAFSLPATAANDTNLLNTVTRSLGKGVEKKSL